MFHCLSVNNIDEREKVSFMFCRAISHFGETKAIEFFNDMTSKGIRFIDVVNSIEKQMTCGTKAGDVKTAGFKQLIKNRTNGTGRAYRR